MTDENHDTACSSVGFEETPIDNLICIKTYGHMAYDDHDDLFEISLRYIATRLFSQDDCLNREIRPQLFSHLVLPKFKQERHRFCMGLINTAEVLKNSNHETGFAHFSGEGCCHTFQNDRITMLV
jgi:hypothetical protein